MGTVEKRARAEADLLEIWLYVARDSPSAADRFLDSVDQKCDLLARFPEIGRSRPELGADRRSFTVDSCVIFYRVIDSGNEIVRILSGFRDILHGDLS